MVNKEVEAMKKQLEEEKAAKAARKAKKESAYWQNQKETCERDE
jgi:hypothetical protein